MENFTDLDEWLHLKDYDTNFNTISDQKDIIVKKKLECYGLIMLEPPRKKPGLYCNVTWDNITCWPATKAGTTAVQPCPDYINGLDTTKNVTRSCNADGTWFVHPEYNTTWSDYHSCTNGSGRVPMAPPVPDVIKEHMQPMSIMVNTGYGLSLASLVVAVFIMLYFKKLHCPRNTIHLNLFLSFILRALISFIKKGVMIEETGFAGDVYYDKDGQLQFIQSGLHWECRMFMTIVNYIIAANYAWIFVEALYLQMLISVAVFTEKKHLHIYMLLGWTFPLLFIIPWVIVRAKYANKFCWTTHDSKWVLWIIHGPILITIIVNFVIFINIVRVLFTKLNASPCPETKKFRYRRLAKSTLVLIPLFGVYYLVFSIIFNIFEKSEGIGLLIILYIEMFFNSFQGFFLSLLFCFFNSEVQNEFKKAWRRYSLQRSGSSRWRSTFISRTRSLKERRNSEENGVAQEANIRSNEQKVPSSPTTTNGVVSPNTQSTFAFDTKTHLTTREEIEIDEQTPWLNNNHTAYVEQHVPPFEHEDERL